jgi:hypothetical protein
MRKLIYILCILLVSCNVSKQVATGEYRKKGTDISYSLTLNAIDSTFILEIKYFHTPSECMGTWKQKGNTIFLKCCKETDIAVMLSSGYLAKREFAITVKNSNKLKFENVILKRQKNKLKFGNTVLKRKK